MSKPEVVIAIYKPKNGKTQELESLVQKHFSVLRQYELATEKTPFIGLSEDGSIIEIFE